VLHPDERTLPFDETAWYESSDDGARVLVDPRTVRDEYLSALASLVSGYRGALQRARIPFAELDTGRPAVDTLADLVAVTLSRPQRGR
jgi:hypothetical protein